MSEEPQSIWKKPWKGVRGLFLWFIVLGCATFVGVFALEFELLSDRGSNQDLLTVALISSFSIAVAIVLLIAFVRWPWLWRKLSIWKKPWKGDSGIFLWFIVLGCATFLMVFGLALLSEPDSSENLLTFALISSISIAAAMVLLVAFVRWLFCWRNLKRVLFGGACLATLIALFYAEENWRGKHAWGKFKREWEAKGEKFDLASVSPPQVPDDQNFAMTPLWVEEICGMMGMKNAMTWYGDKVTALGHTNFVRPLEMATELRQLRFTNQMRGWQQANTTDLQAWQEYYQRVASLTNYFPHASEPGSPAQDILVALSKYEPSIEKLRVASQLPHARFPLSYTDDDPAGILLPHLASLKGMIITLQLRAVAELQAGQTEKALDDIKLMFRLMQSIHGEPVLISHLVRIAMLQILLQPIWEGMADHRWTDAQLLALDAELGKLDFLADYQFFMRGEAVFNVRLIDFVQASRRLGMLEFAEDKNRRSDSSLQFQLWLARFGPRGWFEQNKVAYCRMNFDLMVPIVNRKTRTFSPPADAHAMKTCNEIRLTPYNWLTHFLLPGLNKCAERFARAQSSVDEAGIASALERYYIVHRKYPDTLDVLTPQFIQKLPHDIINGQPLKYRRTDDGQFNLYSVGWNEKDDGGIYPTSNTAQTDGRYKFAGSENSEEGDWVWRYPVKE